MLFPFQENKNRKRAAAALLSIIMILTIVIISCGCGKAPAQIPPPYDESDWERMGLKGETETLTLYEVEWQEAFGKISISSAEATDQTTRFNQNGNQTESCYYDINGNPSWKDVFNYESDGKTWLECVSYKPAQPGSEELVAQWSYTNIYDNTGRLNRIEGYDYDSAGQKLPDNTWVHLYSYDEAEGKLERASFDETGVLQWKNISTYNEFGQEIEAAHYDDSGAVIWRDTFKYDSAGNKTEWVRYADDGTVSWKDVFTYDAEGNETECSNYDYTGKLMWKTIYIYINEFDLDGFEISNAGNTENSFDENGNWTIKLTLDEKEGFGSSYYEVKEIEKRALSYY